MQTTDLISPYPSQHKDSSTTMKELNPAVGPPIGWRC